MNMIFKKLFKNKINDRILSVVDGTMINVSQINDQVFSKKMLGDSVAFLCEGEEIVCTAPINGRLCTVFPTGHAYGIVDDNGLEVLVHIGIDTVNDQGKGFELLVSQDQNVKAGDAIVKVKYNQLSLRYEMPIIVIITNSSKFNIKFNDYGIYKKDDIIATIV